MTEYFLGIDLHKETAFWTLIDNQGQIIDQKTVPVKQEEIEKAVNNLPRPVSAVLEPTCSWRLYSRILEKQGVKVALAAPLKVKAIASNRLKNDRVDSEILAQLLRMDFLPKSFLPDENLEELKQLIHFRILLVRINARFKQILREMIIRKQDSCPARDIFSQKAQKWLKKSSLFSENQQFEKEIALKIGLLIQNKIKEIDIFLKEKYQNDPEVKILTSIPVFSNFTAMVLKAEIGDWQRFSNPGKLCAWAGLVPSSYDSGPRTRRGKITHQGSHILRWILYQAALRVKPSWGNLWAFYQRIAQKGSKKKARVALARKLLCLSWYLIKKQELCQTESVFLKTKRSDLVFSLANQGCAID